MTTLTPARMLIVDDEAELNSTLCEALNAQGHEAVGFTSARLALEALQQQSFDLLLTDLTMPEMDGLDLLQSAIDIDPQIVGVVMTGHGTVNTAVSAMKMGACDYVLKPFKMQSLLPILERALEVRWLRLENMQLREAVEIYELSQLLAITPSFDAVMDKVVNAAMKQCGADEASIMLPTEDGKELYVAIARGEGRENIVGKRVPIGEGVAGWVARQHEPLLLQGKVKDARYTPLLPRSEILSSISMPMMAGGKLIGVLNVNAIHQRPFTMGKLKAMIMLSGTAASALESVSLYTQLRVAGEKYRSIFENAIEGIFQRSPEGKYNAVNPALAQIMGYDSPDDFIQNVQDVRSIYVEPQRYEEYLQLMREHDTVAGFEAQVYRKDRSTLWVALNVRAIRDADGNLVHYEGAIEDISERKRAEAALETTLEQMRHLFENLDDVFFSVDSRTGEVLYMSPTCEKIYGRPAVDFFENPGLWFDVVHREDKHMAYRQKEALDAGYSVHDEYRIILPDGASRWIETKIKPTTDSTGQTIRIDGVVADVTRRKQAEIEISQNREALQRANDQLEAHVEERTAELAAVNDELRVSQSCLLKGNQVFTELSRLRVSTRHELENALHDITEACCESLESDRCSIWVFDESQTAMHCLDLYECKSRNHSSGAEMQSSDFPRYFEALKAGRTIVAHDAHAHPATSEFARDYLTPLGISSMLDIAISVGGQLAGVLCCEHIGEVRDWKVEEQTFASSATAICSLALESYERAKAENALRAAKEEADRANLAKSEFLSRMSHELRTPLNAILGFGQILEMQESTPLQSESIEHILKAGHHLLELVNEVLDIARVESGRMDLSVEPASLVDIVSASLDLVRPLAAQHKVFFEGEETLSAHDYILADRQRLKQVFINLFSNAVKYNRRGGKVRIGCQHLPDGRLRFDISDSGWGIAQADLEKIFLPFERLSAGQTEVEGTGLGLALSKRLIEAMNGELSVQSTVDIGSTFSVTLPTAQSPLSQIERTEEDSPEENEEMEANRVVLSIEDNVSNHRLIQTILASRPNVKLLCAMQGSIGLDMAYQHKPDLILLDLHLPDISGHEVLRRLRNAPQTRHIPVVILSADATKNQIERLMAAGANLYLTKPLNVRELLRAIDSQFATETTETMREASR